jgi:hypothetical protein
MSTLTDIFDPDCAPAGSDPPAFGGVEAGGTKWVCAKGTGPGDLTEVEVIPTTTPPETLGRVVESFKRDSVRVAALGVGTFGPSICESDRRRSSARLRVCVVVVAGAEVVRIERAPSVSYLSTPDRVAGQFRRLDERS